MEGCKGDLIFAPNGSGKGDPMLNLTWQTIAMFFLVESQVKLSSLAFGIKMIVAMTICTVDCKQRILCCKLLGKGRQRQQPGQGSRPKRT